MIYGKRMGILLNDGHPFIARRARLPGTLDAVSEVDRRFSLILETDQGRIWAPNMLWYTKVNRPEKRCDVTLYFNGLLAEMDFTIRSQSLLAGCLSGLSTDHSTKRIFAGTIINFTYLFQNVFWFFNIEEGIHRGVSDLILSLGESHES